MMSSTDKPSDRTLPELRPEAEISHIEENIFAPTRKNYTECDNDTTESCG